MRKKISVVHGDSKWNHRQCTTSSGITRHPRSCPRPPRSVHRWITKTWRRNWMNTCPSTNCRHRSNPSVTMQVSFVNDTQWLEHFSCSMGNLRVFSKVLQILQYIPLKKMIVSAYAPCNNTHQILLYKFICRWLCNSWPIWQRHFQIFLLWNIHIQIPSFQHPWGHRPLQNAATSVENFMFTIKNHEVWNPNLLLKIFSFVWFV